MIAFSLVVVPVVWPWPAGRLAVVVLLGPVANIVGLWLALPAVIKRSCPAYQRVIGGIGLLMNLGCLGIYLVAGLGAVS